jgi:hypothetical protein
MKSIFASKTAWLQIITLIAAFVPPVQAFLVVNPVAAVAVISAANVLVRFFTADKVALFPDPAGVVPGAATLPAWVVWLGMGTLAGVSLLPLSGCTQAQISAAESIPIHSQIRTDRSSLGYDSQTGVDVEVDATSGK